MDAKRNPILNKLNLLSNVMSSGATSQQGGEGTKHVNVKESVSPENSSSRIPTPMLNITDPY